MHFLQFLHSLNLLQFFFSSFLNSNNVFLQSTSPVVYLLDKVGRVKFRYFDFVTAATTVTLQPKH